MNTTIEKHVGDLLSVSHGIIVHGCNAQGVMGAGVAAAVRATYPGAYDTYRAAHSESGLKVGQIVPYTAKSENGCPGLIIVNAITQEFYGQDGRRYVDYDGVRKCFEQVADLARRSELTDVHFPLIGCGLAGGNWPDVAPIIEQTLAGLNAHLWVLE